MSDNGFIHKEAFWVLAGDLIGSGMSRKTYACATNKDWVVKVEEDSRRFQNVMEWETWKDVRDTPFAKWFAPCIHISPCGGVLIMGRTELAGQSEYPEKMPAFLTDFKRTNYGMYTTVNPKTKKKTRHIACHDYGTALLIQTGLTKRMKNANWWDEA